MAAGLDGNRAQLATATFLVASGTLVRRSKRRALRTQLWRSKLRASDPHTAVTEKGVSEASTPPTSSSPQQVGFEGGLPAPRLEGTRWHLKMDIGRTTFTLMPLSWATGGLRVELSIAVEFREGGELAMLCASDFVGAWMEPVEDPPLVQLLPLLSAFLPEPEMVLTRPSFSGGKWWLEDDGRTVRFWVETSGFRRDNLWVPKGKLYFRAQAYGILLAPGKSPAVTLRESRSLIGAAAGAFAGMTLGPAASLLCALGLGYNLRAVPISLGRWKHLRLEPSDEEAAACGRNFLPQARMTKDDPRTWQ
eukprot:TRINITY_DN20504_c0_g1_i1.p1 TRINITY_DN20504_c0_g1~~TRINITY_DN20504_c0_g1_i1.p1  ORF type:complete len:306 (-),score=34.25 TRINITY_DN20504_c0_g1_i1:265-1182(-)